MADAFLVNDRDLADLGFVLERFRGPTDGVVIEIETEDVPGRYGVMPVAPEGRAAVRDITPIGDIEAASQAELDAKYSALKDWVARGMVEVRTGLNTAKVFHGWYRQAPGDPYAPQLVGDAGRIELSFRCFDPLGYDVDERVVTLSATPAQIPQGPGPLVGALRTKGITTSPLVFTKRDHAGRPTGLLTLGFAGKSFTLGANDRVEINSLAGTIVKYTAGVPSDATEFLLATSDFPLVIGKDESDRDAGAYATLEISGLGSGGSGEWIGARTHE